MSDLSWARFISVPEWIDGRVRGQFDDDCLQLGVCLQSRQPVFPPESTHLISAIRQHPMGGAESVDRYQAGLDLGRDAMSPCHVRGPQPPDQTVLYVIGHGNYLQFVVKGNRRQNGTKYLFLGQAAAIIHIRKQRGLDEITLGQMARPRST